MQGPTATKPHPETPSLIKQGAPLLTSEFQITTSLHLS